MWIDQTARNMRRIAVALVALSSLGASGCGGSSDDEDADEVAVEAPKVLEPNAAGKACSGDMDCGAGTCKTEFSQSGGAQPAPGGYCTLRCNLDADCGEGGVCFVSSTGGFGFGTNSSASAKECMARCDSSSQCREGYRCLDTYGQGMESNSPTPAANATGACQVAPETDMLPAGVVGSMCAADGDCAPGTCMTQTQGSEFPGGYCTGRCLDDSDCGEGGDCQSSFGGATGTCYLKCAADSDCRDGYRCRANAFSQSDIRRCVPGADPLPDGTVGSSCTGDGDCGGNPMSCFTMNGDRVLPEGYCSQACVEAIDCGAGGVCAGGYCYKTCSAEGDCRQGYECQSFGGGGMMGGAGQMVCALPRMSAMDDVDAGM